MILFDLMDINFDLLSSNKFNIVANVNYVLTTKICNVNFSIPIVLKKKKKSKTVKTRELGSLRLIVRN